jgi:3',5'-cyclic AMP phosphodiesterase CpdA
MPIFNTAAAYSPERDVRLAWHADLAAIVRAAPANGALWLVLAPRRYGKTWTLKGLQLRLGDSSKILDLRSDAEEFLTYARPPLTHLLLDECNGLIEPARKVDGAAVRRFLQHCETLTKLGTVVVLALTPRELDALLRHDPKGARCSPRSIIPIPPLTAAQARAQTRDQREALTLVSRLPPPWLRSPYLLEWLFQHGGSSTSPADLATAFMDAESQHRYFHAVFWDSLTEDQQGVVCRIASGKPASESARRGAARDGPNAVEVLRLAGLIQMEAQDTWRVADPVLEAQCSPLRIHHLSDLHFGSGPSADSGLVRQSYLDHLRELRARGQGPHLAVISGDLVETMQGDELRAACEWVKELEALLDAHVLLDPSEPRVLVVGGNHDVDWSQAHDPDSLRHRAFALAFDRYHHPHLEEDPASRRLSRVTYDRLELEFVLLGSSQLAAGRPELSLVASTRAPPWPGQVHPLDLDRIQGHTWTKPVRVAVLHHPVSPHPSTELKHFGGLINAGAVKQVLMQKGFSLVLCGHVHAGWFAEERWPGLSQTPLRIVSAPTLGSHETTEHSGYNSIEVERTLDRLGRPGIQVHIRRFVRQREGQWSLQDEPLFFRLEA